MSRILKAYQTRFYQLLRQAGARRVDRGVDWLVGKARRLAEQKGTSLAEALGVVGADLAARAPFHRAPQRKRTPADILFFCDAGLGGLARWLRAAGYCAAWEQGIADDELLRRGGESGATILTTDSMLMERRVLRDRIIPALWLPPVLSISQQLAKVFCEFSLTIGSPRCMTCGGELAKADKESLRERIPPKTYRWRNEYFVCTRCGKLFWHGTHWSRIVQELRAVESGCAGQAAPAK